MLLARELNTLIRDGALTVIDAYRVHHRFASWASAGEE